MEELMSYVFQHKHLFIGIVTSILGATVRISHDKEVQQFKLRRFVGYYASAVFVAYLFYQLFTILGLEKWIGLVCSIAGLISGSVINFLIKDVPSFLPSIIEDWVRKKFDVDKNKEQTNTDFENGMD